MHPGPDTYVVLRVYNASVVLIFTLVEYHEFDMNNYMYTEILNM